MSTKSFFQKLTGGMRMNEDEESLIEEAEGRELAKKSEWAEEEEGQLTVDVYQTPAEIIVQTMVAGVRPEDLTITISRDMITIKGKREENRTISEDNFFLQELYWGSFSRTILLPEEIDPEEAEAIEKHGLLIIKLPKIDKEKKTSLRIKSV
ncbi:MAG TPA: Hsp20/alpha crystallin family protein [Candidatus Paceibacterota bacterium]